MNHQSVAYWRSALALWRRLALAQLRQQPLRLWLSLLTVAIGVALCTTVWLISSSALLEFSRAGSRLAGDAELSIRGSAAGFAETLYAELARDPAVQIASPMLELDVALADRPGSLHVLGLDLLRAAPLLPSLLPSLLMAPTGQSPLEMLTGDGIRLSAAAARRLQLQAGDELPVLVGEQRVLLAVLGVLPEDAEAASLGIMDIASAQWRLQRLGVLNRIDLRLNADVDAQRFGAQLQSRLPAGVVAVTPETANTRVASATRAYRVNLNLLALVSLLTGSLLLLAAQSLSLLQRRSSLALLRALGMTRRELQWALAGEGAVLGLLGSLIGVLLGQLASAALLAWIDAEFAAAGSIGAQLAQRMLSPHPLIWAGFVLLGTASATLGAWLPAREAARRAPALALKAGDAAVGTEGRHFPVLGAMLLIVGAALAWLPAVAGLPLFGYLSIALLLFGGLLLSPAICGWLLAHAPRSGVAVFDIGLAQLRGSRRQIALNLAAVIVSFSLMIAMAIMVYSFRGSFELWLQQSLPADLQLRTNGNDPRGNDPRGNDTRTLSVNEQRQLAQLPGVARADFIRNTRLLLRAEREPVTLSARDATPERSATALPVLHSVAPPAGAQPVWISEAMQTIYGTQAGDIIELPVGGRTRWFVAGVFRDYGLGGGAIVMPREAYIAASGDHGADQAGLWLTSGADVDAVIAAARTLTWSRGMELLATPELRAGLLRGFDRVFAITYLMEAAAVLIGLAGVALAGAAATAARRGEFGMLRHLGLLRRQILAMLAGEGLLMGAVGMLYGLLLGCGLSLVLVYVVNRQSFNWSIDLAMPWWQLGALCAALLVAATVANLLSARAALGVGALRAVREDW